MLPYETHRTLVTTIRCRGGEILNGFGALDDGRSVYIPPRIVLVHKLVEGIKYTITMHKSGRPNKSDFVATSVICEDGIDKLWNWLDSLEDADVDVDLVMDKMLEFKLVASEEEDDK